MANVPGNPAPLLDATRVLVSLGSDQAEDDLFTQWSTSDEGSVSNVQAPNGILGSRRASGGNGLTLTQEKRRDPPAVDYRQLLQDDAVFDLEIQTGYFQGDTFIAAESLVWTNARVSTVSDSAGADGTMNLEVAITAGQPKLTRFSSP